MEKIITQYLAALAAGDYEALMSLFGAEAVVHSPLYGAQPAASFYRDLLRDTEASTLEHLGTYLHASEAKACAHFRYDWAMRNGQRSQFECVDVFRFDAEGKIAALAIIYDTAGVRPLWEH